jgi:hypothetical protein
MTQLAIHQQEFFNFVIKKYNHFKHFQLLNKYCKIPKIEIHL